MRPGRDKPFSQRQVPINGKRSVKWYLENSSQRRTAATRTGLEMIPGSGLVLENKAKANQQLNGRIIADGMPRLVFWRIYGLRVELVPTRAESDSEKAAQILAGCIGWLTVVRVGG